MAPRGASAAQASGRSADVRCMPFPRSRRLVQGQGGSTLIELLIAMPIAIVLLGLVVQSLGTAGRDQQDIEGRTEALTNGQIGLEKMTRELRQATWVYFRSSAVVDVNVPVRATAGSTGTDRLVRYDCSTDTCERLEGPPVSYPPGSAPTFTESQHVLGDDAETFGHRDGQIVDHDVFRPTHVDAATGARTVNFVNPDFLFIRIQLAFRDRRMNGRTGKQSPMVLEDGVSLRNRSTYAG